jgi:hypothetical protein
MDGGNVAHRNFSAERTYFLSIAKPAVAAVALAIGSSSILTGCGGGARQMVIAVCIALAEMGL